MITDEMVERALSAKYADGDVSDMLRGAGDEETAIMRAALEAAIGDMVRDVQRYRHMRKDGVIWRVNMLALAKDDIDILFGAKADAAIDAAMQAKEAAE